MSVENKATNGNVKAVRRVIEYAVIGASCLYLGMQALKKNSTK